MQKLALSWLLGGVLFCVLLVDLVLLNYNQQCSLCVQLDTAASSQVVHVDRDAPDIDGFRLIQPHSNTKKGTGLSSKDYDLCRLCL